MSEVKSNKSPPKSVAKSQKDDAKSKKSNSPSKADDKANKLSALKQDFKKEDAKSNTSPPKSKKNDAKSNKSPEKSKKDDVKSNKSPDKQKKDDVKSNKSPEKSKKEDAKSNKSPPKSPAKSKQSPTKSNSPSKVVDPKDKVKSQKSLSPPKKNDESILSQQDLPPGSIKSGGVGAKSVVGKNKSMADINDIASIGKADAKSIQSGSPNKKGDIKAATLDIGDASPVSKKSLSKDNKNQTQANKGLGQSLTVKQDVQGFPEGVIQQNQAGVNQSVVMNKKAVPQNPTANTVSQNYGQNMTMAKLEGSAVHLSDNDIQAQLNNNDYNLQAAENKLEAIQKQKPPSKQEELIEYLMKRLEASENSIKVAEEVIQSERVLRKASAQQMSQQTNDLNTIIAKEKKKLSDQVNSQLGQTLKQAQKETETIIKKLEEETNLKDFTEKEFDELNEKFSTLKETEEKNKQINYESERNIDQYQKDNALLEDQIAELEKANLDAEAAAEQAVKDFEEVKAVISKLDESRFIMNKLMNGPIGNQTRSLQGGMPYDNQGIAASGLNPVRSGSGLLQHNQARNYYNNAGIGGSQASLGSGGYGGQYAAKPPLGRQGLGQQQQLANNSYDNNAEDDEFWYQSPRDGGAPVNQSGYGNQNRNY